MILSDNETTIDRLNNRAIAVTIADIIKNSSESVSIGVHGDWGAGKSSVLAMVETELNPDATCVEDVAEWDEKDEVNWEGTEGEANTEETYLTVRFNSWQYLGFEDAKIALMSAIVSGLEKKAKAYYKKNRIKGGLKKLKNIAKRTWDNLDKLGLVKSVGKLGIATISGAWPLIITGSVAGTFKYIADNPDKATDVIETIGSLLQGNGTETRGFKEIEEFRKNFQELFCEAHIKKLIVLIDDLDRCLPRVAIETLEAVRMFLLLQNTAFVIAADELMIRYAVQEYFPRMPEQDGDKPEPIRFDYRRFSDKYLEKLIQIPLHIPRLGIAEARLYIMLLLIESEIGETNELKKLAQLVNLKLNKPWALEQLTTEEIQKALGEKYSTVTDKIMIAMNIDSILSEHTNGNPRNIKRFVNMLLLRTELAYKRGFPKKDLQMAVLAKMMLAEQYNYDFYKEIAGELDDEGKWPGFTKVKVTSEVTDTIAGNGTEMQVKQDAKKQDGQEAEVDGHNEKKNPLLQDGWVKKWIAIEPSLENVDLRPYFFACTEKEDFFFASPEERLRELVAAIRGGRLSATTKKDAFVGLCQEDAIKLFKIASDSVYARKNSLTEIKAPKFIEGLRVYVKYRPDLQKELINFILRLPAGELGIWALGGWEECIPNTSIEIPKLKDFYKKIERETTNPFIKEAARKAQE